MSLVQDVRTAWADPSIRSLAIEADGLFRTYCAQPMPRVPGCDTVLRMAVRIKRGNSVEQAAAREYSYRWHLFADRWVNHAESRSVSRFLPSVWTAPHEIGA